MGLFTIQGLPGERKSGTPHSVEMPAPVNPRIVSASAKRAARRSAPSRGLVIGGMSLDVGTGDGWSRLL